MLKLIFLIIGLAALVGIVLHIGLEPILHTTSQLGFLSLSVILLPMILVYGLEAFGWQLTLGPHGRNVRFLGLFAIRMAGETVNVTTPTAYVGGEPLKAYLLKRYGVLHGGWPGVGDNGEDHNDSGTGAFYFSRFGIGVLDYRRCRPLLDGHAGELGFAGFWYRAICHGSTLWHWYGMFVDIAKIWSPISLFGKTRGASYKNWMTPSGISTHIIGRRFMQPWARLP